MALTLEEILAADDSEKLAAIGKKLDPSSTKLSGLQKVLQNAKAFKGVFGEDSETLGRNFRAQVLAQQAMGDLEDSLAEKKTKREISLKFDQNGDGKVTFKEMPLTEQKRLRGEGFAPTKDEDISSQVHGPTRALFQDLMKPDESGGMIPDEFGGAYGSKKDVGLSPFGEKAMGSDQGADLLTSLVGGDTAGTEKIARQFDPGLQASQTVEDPEGALSDAVLYQALDAVNTDLKTPRSHAEAQTIDKATLGTSLAAIMMQTGASESEVLATMDVLPDNVPVAFANQLLSQVASARGETAKIAAKAAQTKEVQNRLDTRQQERYKLITNLKDHTAAIGVNTSANLKFLGYQYASQLQSEAFGQKQKIKYEEDKRRFAHDLEMFTKKETLTKEESQFKFGAQAVLQTMRGQAALNMETVKQGHRLALKNAGPNANNKDVLKEFITDFMKSSPQVAEQFVDLIANTPPGEDPFMVGATREAMADLYKEIVDADTAFEVVRVAQGTDIAADTLKEKTAWLMSEKNRLGAGQPSLGIPPMSPDQLKIIQNQIDFNQELMEAGGQNITVMGDEKPLTPEQAGKIADVYLNTLEIEDVRGVMFNEQGDIDRGLLQTMQDISLLPDFIKEDFGWDGVPFTKGREVSQKLKRIIDTIVRAKSGAEVRKDEWPRFKAMFWPMPFDNAQAIHSKIDRLQSYGEYFLSLADPRGAQRTKMSAGKPQQSLKSPSKQKPRKQVIRELLDSGVDPNDVPKALEGMGY